MSIATQSLKYGWVALATLSITGATIFVANNTMNRITTATVIQIVLGVTERALATQYQTNPVAYRVDPPVIVRTWTDTNGASISMTNALAWRDDLSMKIELDTKLIALCPYYVDTDSVYDGTTNIIMHTFTGLLTSLDLGDHTNFTAIPAIGTNIATYGPWAWRNYVVAWQERYKVLEALKMTTCLRNRSYNGSDDKIDGGYAPDPVGQSYSNTVTGEVVGPAFYPHCESYIIGILDAYAYTTGDTNGVWTSIPPYNVDYKMSFAEWKSYSQWHFFVYLRYIDPERPPWTDYPDGYTWATNEVDKGAGSYWAVRKEGKSSSEGITKTWYWWDYYRVTYSTWEFIGQYPDQQITNTYSIYLKPTLPEYPTEIKEDTGSGYWVYPRTWDITVSGKFEELAGMPTNVFSILNVNFITDVDGILTIEFGSDEFAPLTFDGSGPEAMDAPTSGTAARDWYDNTGSVGTMKGSYVNPDDYFMAKTWQFNYCTNKYW